MALLELDRHMDAQIIEVTEKFGEPYLGSLENPTDINRAVSLVQSGKPIVAQVRGVFGIWFRGDLPEAVARVREIKEDDPDKKYSAMMFCQDFVPLIDQEAIPQAIRHLFQNPDMLQQRVGAICHIRAPITSSSAPKFPSSMISQTKEGVYFVHNLDPHGHKPISNFIIALNQAGFVTQIGVSTLNRDNEPEIHNLNRALQVSRESGIKMILQDPTHTRKTDLKGSFAIWDASQNKAIRDGHVPIEVVMKILGIKIDTSSMKPPKYPQIKEDFELLLSEGLSEEDLRLSVLEILHRKPAHKHSAS